MNALSATSVTSAPSTFKSALVILTPRKYCSVCNTLEAVGSLSECVLCGKLACDGCLCPCVPEPSLGDIVTLGTSALFARITTTISKHNDFVMTVTDDLGELLFCTGDTTMLFVHPPVIGKLLRKQLTPAVQKGQGARELMALANDVISHMVEPVLRHWAADVVPYRVGGRMYLADLFISQMP